MASNDSGVDTSNDSNDSGAAGPSVFPRVGDYGNFLLPNAPKKGTFFSAVRKIRCRRGMIHFENKDIVTTFMGLREHRIRKAVGTNNTEYLKRLLERGMCPNLPDDMQRTNLHIAACRGYTEVAELLLKYGANPNARDILGNTPLHLAACNSNVKMVTLLLRVTDITTEDHHGRNPIQLAQSKLKLITVRRLVQQEAPEMNNILQEVQMIIEMMMTYLEKKKVSNPDLEELSNRVAALTTTEGVDNEVSSLLANLESLTIDK